MTEPFPIPQPGYQPVAPAPKKRKKWPWVVGAIILVLGLAGALGDSTKEDGVATTAAAPSSQVAVAPTTAPKPSMTSAVPSMAPAAPVEPAVNSAPAAPAPVKPQVSSSQRNAVRSAQDYLDYSAFSRSGLIDQLEFEGFSTEDATYAVDSVNPDWNEQAARSAEQYLDYTSFSKSGLIDQLVFEGFTYEQAEYGADAAY